MGKNLVYGFLFILIVAAGGIWFSIYYQDTYLKVNTDLVTVDIDNDYWTANDVTITVNYLNPDIPIESYSFDGGKTWQSKNTYVVSENQTLAIVLKTKQGKKSDVIHYRVDNIDKTSPEIISDQVVYVARGTDFTYRNKYSVIDLGSGIKGNVQIEPETIDTSAYNTFEVKISAQDRALNEITKKMIVEIVDPNDPILGGAKEKPVTGLTLSDTTISLVKGTSQTVTAKVKPSNATNQAISWRSANENVATVDQKGVITGVQAGTTTITASTIDGSKSSDVRVIVTNERIEVTEITLDRISDTMTTDDEDIVLTPTIKPDNATNTSIRWNSSNTSVAIVVNGAVQIRGEGTTKITATTSNGKVATYTLTVVDNYTFQEREVLLATGELMGYTIKIYKNGVDITKDVTAITSPFTARNEGKERDEIEITIANHQQLGRSITFNYGTKRHTAYK